MRIFHFIETYDRGKRTPPICGAKTGHETTFETVVTCKRCLLVLRIKVLIQEGCRDLDLDDVLSWEIYKDFLRRISKKRTRNMEGKTYRHPRFGLARVITQSGYVPGSPRNVLIRTRCGYETIVPQRSLRLPPGGGSPKKGVRP